MAGARAVELYTRFTLYSFALIEPFFLLVTVAALAEEPPSTAVAAVLAVLAVLHVVLCPATVHAGLAREPFRSRWSRAVLVALAVVTLALVMIALLAVPTASWGGENWYLGDPRSVLVVVVGGFTLAALSPVLTMRGLAIGTAVTTVVVVLGRALGGVGGLVGLGIAVFVAVLFLAGSFRLTVWILFVVRELDASRDVHARLAVAEERLRFSRDLHDVVGRALSAVAVKSELAAELARRGDERAVDEMLQVRTLAHDSLREVRGVVAGYRAADLATELAGARSVLRAAGVEARVVGDVPDLATPQAEALAWVVREAVTNVVRHSHAAACALRLDQEEGATALRVTNDGVRAVPREDAAGGPGGSGLAGLRERLAAVGGTLAVRHDGDRFTLTARVPTPDRHDPYALVAAEEGA
jgi:two-component system sensor histidine kinase DesK